VKFNGVLEEIIERYPNIDLIEFLQQKLELPCYKAEELATRIEKEYLLKTVIGTEQKIVHQILEKPNKSELPSKKSIYSLESLSEKEFEYFIKWLLEEIGYELQQVEATFDSGFDLVTLKEGEKISVQARRYPTSFKVSNCIIMTSQEAMRIHGYKRSIIIVTSYFTQQAILDAEKANSEIWDADTLAKKIIEVRKAASLIVQPYFPQYKGSLLQSLLALDKTKDFIIEPRTGRKYDLFLPNVKFPLLTFQAHSDDVIKCVYRIKNNEPVGESEGITLISIDQDNNRLGPNDTQAYTLIMQYLEEFVE
jgi:HJR/Mrr/RecB family endonuclease